MRLIDLVPAQYLADHESRRLALMVLSGIGIGLVSAVLFFIAMVMVSPFERALVSLVWTVPIGLTFFVLRFGETPATAAHFFTFIIALGVSVTFAVHGGNALIAFVGVPVTAALLLSRLSAVLWTVGTTVWILALGITTGSESLFSPMVATMALLVGMACVVAEAMRSNGMRELQLERERTRHVVETLFPGLIDVDGTRITYVGEGIASIGGYIPEDLIGQDIMEFIHRDDEPQALAWMTDQQPGQSLELRLRHKEGHWVWTKVYLVPEFQGSTRHTFAGYDISAERESRDRASQSQRLDSIGVLASGVAHDFNNMLTVISGFAELLDESDMRHNILHASHEAASLVQKLMAFGKGSNRRQSQSTNICQVVSNSEQVLDSILGPAITLHVNTPAQSCWVGLSSSQISQVLLNLVTNAKEALGLEGNVWLDVEIQREDDVPSDITWVQLSVSDDGLGMSDETQQRAFDPFFTTKDNRTGTGLGLSSVYGIARHAGGSVWIDSEPGQGCCVSLKVPLTSHNAAETEPEVTGKVEHKQGRILVVDDDELVADLVARCLVQVGYSVTIKNDVNSAWQALSEDVPDLLITDIMMPDGKGTELAQRVQDSGISEDLPILFISGYADDEISGWQDAGRSVKFLAKPFRAQELLNRVGQLLSLHTQSNARNRTGTY